MQRSWIPGALFALTASCGSSSSPSSDVPDSAMDTNDASVDTTSDDTSPASDTGDAEVPVGKLLGPGIALGVTSDDFAILNDLVTFRAVPLGGGASQTIAPTSSAPPSIAVFDKVMLAGISPPSGSKQDLWVWTSAHGPVKLASAPFSFEQSTSPVSSDGANVAYVANAGPTGDVVVAKVDGTGATTLLSGVGTPQVTTWAGDHYLVVLRQNAAEAGPPSYTLTAFDESASWAKVDLSTDVAGFGSTRHGKTVVVRDAGGTLRAYPLDGSAATTLDTGATRGTFMLDDATVVYATSAGALKRVAITGGTPTTLVASDFATNGDFFSPDAKTMVYWKPAAGDESDLAVARLDAPSTPVVLTGTTTSGIERLPEYFTTDSTMIMFLGDLTAPTQPLYAAPIAGAPIKTIATKTAGARWAVGGTKIVFADDAVAGTSTMLPYGTLKTVDLAATAPPTAIVSHAGLNSIPSSDRKSLVYTAIGPTRARADASAYVTPIP